MSIAVPSFAKAKVDTDPPRETVHNGPIYMRFADAQCDALSIEQPSIAFSSPLNFKKIDRLIRTFLKGPSPKAKSASYSKPDTRFASLYAGFHLDHNSITVIFSAGAERYLNGTTCEQTVNRTPLEHMLMELKGVQKVNFEVAGKRLGDSDA